MKFIFPIFLIAMAALYVKMVPCYFFKKERFQKISARCTRFSKQEVDDTVNFKGVNLKKSPSEVFYSTYEDEAGNEYDVKDIIRPNVDKMTNIFKDLESRDGKIYPGYIVYSPVFVIVAALVLAFFSLI